MRLSSSIFITTFAIEQILQLLAICLDLSSLRKITFETLKSFLLLQIGKEPQKRLQVLINRL